MSTALAKKSKGVDLSGLDDFNISSLMTAGGPMEQVAPTGKPLEIPLSEIAEDPNQPRSQESPGFSSGSLRELAESIASRGIKSPISVRSKNAEGFHVINHGARRFRAAALAHLKTIPAFIDDEHEEYDQAIENIQRESFTAMEIAEFIGRREGLGESRSAIAKKLGKSKGFVTQHAALLSLPPELRVLYTEGRCGDVLALYELANLNKTYPYEVQEFLRETPEVTRAMVAALKASTKSAAAQEDPDASDQSSETGRTSASPDNGKPDKVRKPSIMVKRGDQLFVLRAELRPSSLHLGWIEHPETNERQEVELADLSIDSIIEG